jgi:pimeloyl-ACP methyl ester carboxylesterase
MTDARMPVVFQNRRGLRLFGVLHLPERAHADLAVILLSPGVKMRVGPERLYCTLTERLVSLGLPVLRFDFWGLGDSEGELREELLKDVYNHIEVGRFVDDTIDSMDWMARNHGIRRFILSGLCGGAITGLLTAQRDNRVAGLLALALTPVLASRSADPSLYLTSGQAAELRRTYLSKLLSPRAWIRLLTLRTDYRLLWRSLLKGATRRSTPVGVSAEAPLPEQDDANPLFPPAFFAMLESNRPILLVYGGSDRLLWEYEEKFVARHRARLTTLPRCHEVHTILQANHVLSFEPWQKEMLEVSSAWLRKWFGADLHADSPGLSAGSASR